MTYKDQLDRLRSGHGESLIGDPVDCGELPGGVGKVPGGEIDLEDEQRARGIIHRKSSV